MTETTREQDAAIDRICSDNDGDAIHVRDGYADKHVEATARSGQCWKIDEDGIASETHPDFSVDWSKLDA